MIEDIDGLRDLVGATTQTTLSPRPRLVLVDDIDAMSSENSVIIKELLTAIARSRWPVIVTAIDLWDPAIRILKMRCDKLEVKPIATAAIASRLKQVSVTEKINVNPQLLQAAATIAHGDMRAGFNYLELLSAGADGADLTALDRARNPFELLAALFKGSSLIAARKALEEADIDLDAIIAWIETNILTEWRQPEQVAAAFEMLSKADMMRRHHVATSRDILTTFALLKGNTGWTRYNPPDRQAIMKQMRTKTVENDAAATALAPMLHCSKSKVKREYLPYGIHVAVKAV